MKVLMDLNVTLDYLQERNPFYEQAALIMDAAVYGTIDGVLPAHGITTINYFLTRGTDKGLAAETTQWLLNLFEIASCDKALLNRALAVQMSDFEDAVTALSGQRTGCSYIVTRNLADFVNSPVPALAPTDLLKFLEGT